MNRNFASALAVAAAAAMSCVTAYADDITVEQSVFVSSLSRDQVNAELKTPYPGGYPWSSTYNMFQAKSTTTREQVTGAYMTSREEVNALNAEDSGSAHFMKSTSYLAANPGSTAAMGGPAR